jgi:hypothetical protein
MSKIDLDKRLRPIIRNKVNDAFQYGEETKGLADYKTVNAALDLTTTQILAQLKDTIRQVCLELIGEYLEIDEAFGDVFKEADRAVNAFKASQRKNLEAYLKGE